MIFFYFPKMHFTSDHVSDIMQHDFFQGIVEDFHFPTKYCICLIDKFNFVYI